MNLLEDATPIHSSLQTPWTEASVFNSDFTENGFFQGFDAKLPCDMMFKKA